MRTSIKTLAIALIFLAASCTQVSAKTETAVFAGGCFWGVEAVFEHVKGVTAVESGYSGGTAETADYETVSTGTTGHAESVRVHFDPSVVSYEKLLFVFFSVAHDPTELNRQGPDTGPQYRSAIFYTNAGQEKAATAFIAAIERSKALPAPVVTEVVPFKAFYAAEDHHQDYLAKNPDSGYIQAYDMPKLKELETKFPELYTPTASK